MKCWLNNHKLNYNSELFSTVRATSLLAARADDASLVIGLMAQACTPSEY